AGGDVHRVPTGECGGECGETQSGARWRLVPSRSTAPQYAIPRTTTAHHSLRSARAACPVSTFNGDNTDRPRLTRRTRATITKGYVCQFHTRFYAIFINYEICIKVS